VPVSAVCTVAVVCSGLCCSLRKQEAITKSSTSVPCANGGDVGAGVIGAATKRPSRTRIYASRRIRIVMGVLGNNTSKGRKGGRETKKNRLNLMFAHEPSSFASMNQEASSHDVAMTASCIKALESSSPKAGLNYK